jgi:hypothetical protein
MDKTSGRPCERNLSASKATGIRELIERLTGEPCPCDQGRTCPMFPREKVGT